MTELTPGLKEFATRLNGKDGYRLPSEEALEQPNWGNLVRLKSLGDHGFGEYYSHREKGKNDDTYIRHFNNFFGLTKPVCEINKTDISKARSSIKGSPSTVNRYCNFLRAVLYYAYEELGWLNERPTIKSLKEQPKRRKAFSAEQAARLHQELPKHLKDPFIFSLLTGVRMKNCFGLKWENINGNKAWINADESKSGRAIAVPLNKRCLDLLSNIKKENEYVFTYAGKQISRASNTGRYNALKRAGLEGYTWHSIRHSWASNHAISGTPLHTLQVLGGWADTNIVTKHYAHLSDDYQTKACEGSSSLVSF